MCALFQNRNIFLVLTYRCNAFCKKCMTRYHIKRDKEMSPEIIELFFSRVESAKYDGWISTGSGEPLIYNDLEKVVKRALGANPGIRMRILSNGMLFTKDLPSVFFNGRCKWGITFDGFSDSSLCSFQYGVSPEVVKNNIIGVVNKYGPDCLYLNYTLHQKNLMELPLFCAFAAELGIREVYSTELMIFEGYEKRLQTFAIKKNSELQDIYTKSRDILTKSGISADGLVERDGSNRYACFTRNAASPIIDVDGSVSFCSGREDIEIGNIKDDDIEQKWKAYSIALSKNPSSWCSKCHTNKLKNGLYSLPKTIDITSLN